MRSGQERRARGTKRVGPMERLSEEKVRVLAVGALREAQLAPGVMLVFEKIGPDEFRALTRGGFPSSWLAQFPTAARVRRGAPSSSGTEVERSQDGQL